MASTKGGAALAERTIEAIWPSLSVARRASAGDTLPAVRAAAYLRPLMRLPEGVLNGLPGAVTGLAVSRDGAHLVAAHYGADAVSLIDTAALAVTATVDGIAEPYAVAAADRAYLRSASLEEDTVVAVDLQSGAALADREVGIGAGAVAVSPAGDVLYVARSLDGVADIAVIEVESGAVNAIPVTRAAGASIDSVRINSAGTRLCAALTTADGAALAIVDIRSGRVQTVPVGTTIGEIAVHADDRRAFVTGWASEHGLVQGPVLNVVDLDLARVVASTPLDALPVAIVSIGSAILLADGDHVAVLDVRTLRSVDSLHIGRPVSCLAVSRDGSRLYVGDYDGSVAALAVPEAAHAARAA